MAIQEVRVTSIDRDTQGEDVFAETQRAIGVPGLERMRTARVYRLEGTDEVGAQTLSEQLFCEPIDQVATLNAPILTDAPKVIEVAYVPGAMNPEVGSILKASQDLQVPLDAADSSTEYAFYGDVSDEDVQTIASRLLVNTITQHIVKEKPETLLISGEVGPTTTVPIREASPEALVELSKDKLFLTLQEMQAVQNHFQELGRDPTDCELEIIAARWSEHCVHKTFKKEIIINGERKKPLFTRIREASEEHFGDTVVTAFKDNAGGYKLNKDYDVVKKIETHNGPSALDGYGGAGTGIGGVVRDILGTGKGAKVVATQDAFCFAPPDTDPSLLPPGTQRPDHLFKKVVEGVQKYGNPYGSPTNNGSVYFHIDSRAKPTVLVGATGIIPHEYVEKGEAQVDDLVVVIGGRTGRDGIHGATFSSGEMTERTSTVNSGAVQIGNPIEEQKFAHAIPELRDAGLIRAITDCGAAGLSSAVGEMGEDVGVTIDLSQAPLKYPGLSPWEILLSEAQERMVIAVDPKNIEQFHAICRKYNVES
ncbi:MAG: AIR synthase-related protein, partial [Candidatus Roizmanbacteria bacterium]|nr:AIR synthase-related protein [Candidatus Roizmanbacteria bacterium]